VTLTLTASQAWSVARTTATSSDLTITPGTTAVRDPVRPLLPWSRGRARDVPGGITMVGGAVLQSSLVVRERETVTDLQTEVNMTAMPAVRETWSVAVTIVSSSGFTIIPKTIAVRGRQSLRLLPNLIQEPSWSLPQERSAAAGTTTAGDAVLLRVPVM